MKTADFVESVWPDTALERVDIPSRPEKNAPIPEWVLQSPALHWVKQETNNDEVWTHQALGLDAWADKKNVALTSGTNSGKSLIAQIPFLHGLLSNPRETYMIVLPFTALNQDQVDRWQRACEALNIPPEQILRIDNTVEPAERLNAMAKARLVFITPHSLHGWFMDNIGNEHVERVLKNMRGIFLDEVQSYDEIMGSNAAFLFRRVTTIRQMLNPPYPLQWIAASGTLGTPKNFLKKLTGQEFVNIGNDQDGSKQNQRSVFHVQAETLREIHEKGKEIAIKAIEQGVEGLILYFIDSRELVEKVAEDLQTDLGRDAVAAYSSRYSRGAGPRDLAQRMRTGRLRVIVTTSALQAGIHLPNANLVINADIPAWINDFHQRLGRSGRGTEDAAMVLIGDGAKFKHFEGEEAGLAAYVHTPPENPTLYTENQAFAFIHAQCLRAERKKISAETRAFPQVVNWPAGFNDIIKMLVDSERGGQISPELRPLLLPKTRSPHREFPLLNIGSRTCYLVLEQNNAGPPQTLVDMPVDQAMIECPPGGNYRYKGKDYFVLGWDYTRSRFRPASWQIKVTLSRSHTYTRGVIERHVQGNLHSGGVINNNFLSHPDGLEGGFLAEMHVRVFTKITGISGNFKTPDGGFRRFTVQYRDVDEETKQEAEEKTEEDSFEDEKPKSRFFAQKLYKYTTGVVVHLPPRFGRESRQVIADALIYSSLNARGKGAVDPHSISTIGTEINNIHINQSLGKESKGEGLVIFDDIQCSLRLTSPVFHDFKSLLEDALLEGDDRFDEKARATIERAIRWYNTLTPQPLPAPVEFMHGTQLAAAPDGYKTVFAEGSLVDRERDGIRTSLKVVGYDWIAGAAPEDEKTLAYRLQAPYTSTKTAWTSVGFDFTGSPYMKKSEFNREAAEAVMIVPESQIQAPLDHVRFSYTWLNIKTSETLTPKIIESTPISGSAPTPEMT